MVMFVLYLVKVVRFFGREYMKYQCGGVGYVGPLVSIEEVLISKLKCLQHTNLNMVYLKTLTEDSKSYYGTISRFNNLHIVTK